MADEARKPSPRELERIVDRGVAEIIPRGAFIDRLHEGRSLRLKMGFDPSAPDLHLGHVVGLRKLRQLQELGHTVVVIVGDWTARIGDPSGRSETRPMLNAEQVMENAETYMRQFFSVVDKARTEVRYQSEWFGDFTLETVMRLMAQFTVNQFLHRDDFAKRYESNSPISLVELLYPLMQAYDSVAVEADVEFGGTDQRFNLLVGRELQEKRGQRPQDVFLVPILPGTDGVRRMGKSLGNYIAVEDSPTDMYGKTMSLPDAVVPLYYDLLTDLEVEELAEVRKAFDARSPGLMDLKKRLAHLLTAEFHGAAEADTAQAHFERVVQGGEAPSEMREFVVSTSTQGVREFREDEALVSLAPFLVEAGLAPSNSEAKRLITSNSVVLLRGNQPAATGTLTARKIPKGSGMTETLRGSGKTETLVDIGWGSILRVGKRKYVRIVKG